MPLTDAKIRSVRSQSKPFKLTDSGGLYLEVRPSGAKLWRYRYRIAGRENVYAVGEYVRTPATESERTTTERRASGRFTLLEARRERDRCRALVKRGVHPSHQRRLERAVRSLENGNTFRSVTLEWIDTKKSGWSPYYGRQVSRFLEANLFPYLGDLPIRNITAAHLLEALRRVEDRGAETVALFLRQCCSAIFRYAAATLRTDGDPAAALKGAISSPRTRHSKPLLPAEIPTLLSALENYGGYRTTTIAITLMLLTFVRTIELRAASWKEIDLDQAEWRVPADRMKMGERHIIPLSRQAVGILHELHGITGSSDLLFPNHRKPKECMSATTINRALERIGFNGKDGIGFSAHGFRSTASTMLNEAGFRPDVIERQLAHKDRNKVRASYNQAEYLSERRAMMQAWADMVDRMAAASDTF
jgi:integrase